MRLVRRPMRHTHEVACIDTTGGFAKVVHLTDNGVKKVLLQLTRNGVAVDMALSPAQARDLLCDIGDALDWTRGVEEAKP